MPFYIHTKLRNQATDGQNMSKCNEVTFVNKPDTLSCSPSDKTQVQPAQESTLGVKNSYDRSRLTMCT